MLVVTTPNRLHAACTEAALDAGLDVFVERPAATSVADATRLATVEAESEGTVMVGYEHRFDPNVKHLVKQTANGDVGSVCEIDATYVRRRGLPELGSWFTRRSEAGGGVLFDVGTHLVHLALTVLDFPPIETISATTRSCHGTEPDGYTAADLPDDRSGETATFDVEDSVRALIRAADGSTVHLDCAWARDAPEETQFQVLGTDGGIHLDPDDGVTVHTTVYDGLSDQQIRTPDRDSHQNEWRYFTEVVVEDRPHDRNTLEQAVEVQRVVDAIYRSAEQNQEVVLDESGQVLDDSALETSE